jgi:hypothetical protein
LVREDDDIVLVLSAINYDAAKLVAVYPHVDPLVASQDKELVFWLLAADLISEDVVGMLTSPVLPYQGSRRRR